MKTSSVPGSNRLAARLKTLEQAIELHSRLRLHYRHIIQEMRAQHFSEKEAGYRFILTSKIDRNTFKCESNDGKLVFVIIMAQWKERGSERAEKPETTIKLYVDDGLAEGREISDVASELDSSDEKAYATNDFILHFIEKILN